VDIQLIHFLRKPSPKFHLTGGNSGVIAAKLTELDAMKPELISKMKLIFAGESFFPGIRTTMRPVKFTTG
jgi:hypothetical protein